MSFVALACILLAVTLVFVWGSLDARLQPPRQMEYRGLGWVNVSQYWATYGTDRFEWPRVFKCAGFFAAGWGCWWLFELWREGLLSYVTRAGVLIFLVLAYWYVFKAVENRFIRPAEDGTERRSRNLVGWIVFAVTLLSSAVAYFTLGNPGFP